MNDGFETVRGGSLAVEDGRWEAVPLTWTAQSFLAVLGGLLFAAILAGLLAWLRGEPGRRRPRDTAPWKN